MKTCSVCGVTKPLDEFHRKAGGRQHNCKLCACAAGRARYHKKMQDPAHVMAERKRGRDLKKRRYHEDPAWREKQRALKAGKQPGVRPRNVLYGRVRKAIKNGDLVAHEHCGRCGHDFSGHKREAHHADYSKPLEVEWLCQPCHSQEHRKPAPATFPPSR